MTSTTAPTGVATPRLERPRDGRMVAGAATGIARHLNVDPTLVRLGFIVAVFAGGLGFAAYLAAFLLIPEEGRARPVLHAKSSGTLALVTGTVLVICGGLMATDALTGDWIGDDVVWSAALLGAGAFLLLRNGGDTATVTTQVTEPDTVVQTQARSRSGTRVVAGALLIVAGALAAMAAAGVDLSWQETAGLGVVAAGAVLVAGSAFGASPWLVMPPLLVAAAVASLAAAGATFDGPIGERHHRPAAVADLPDEYRVAIGELDVDLRGVAFPDGTTRVKVNVGIGEAHVQLPGDVSVRIDAHAGVGDIRLPGGRSDGSDVDRDETILVPGRPVIELDVSTGLGAVLVEREVRR